MNLKTNIMSVCLLSELEIAKITNTLTANEDVLEFVKSTELSKERSKYSYEDPSLTLARAVWYGYIANITAYNLQYQRNEQINYDLESDEYFKCFQEGINTLRSVNYNIATNDGNIFLEDRWSKLLRDIAKKFYVEQDVEHPSYIY